MAYFFLILDSQTDRVTPLPPNIFQEDQKCLAKNFSEVSKWTKCRERCLADDRCQFYEVNFLSKRCRTIVDCDETSQSLNTTIYYKSDVPQNIISTSETAPLATSTTLAPSSSTTISSTVALSSEVISSLAPSIEPPIETSGDFYSDDEDLSDL